MVNCRAERILVEGGRAAGVEGTYAGPDGTTARVVVRAPQVVVACGSIESPALLRRSGIGGPAVGDYLRLHPAGALFATYDEPQDAWWGPPQSALCHEFAEGTDGHGFLLEGAHHSIGIAAAATPWQSGRQHKEDMARLRNTLAADLADPRPRPRTRRRGRGGERRARATASPTSWTSPTSAPA